MEKTVEEMAADTNAKIDAFKEQLKTMVKSEDFKTVEKKVDDFVTKHDGDIDKVTKLFEDLSEKLNVVKDNLPGGASAPKTFTQDVVDKFEEIKELKTPTDKEVILKELVDRADITNNRQAVELPDIGQLAKRNVSLFELFPKITVGSGNHNGTIRYYDWDQATAVRAAATIAEGAVFPESTAKWQMYSLPLQKIGDTLPVTEEFFEDAVMFAAELEMFLRVNVELVVDDQLCNGSGVGTNLKGLLASVPAYVAPNLGLADPTIYDLLVKVREGIAKPYGGKYTPNVAVMNLSTINRYKLEKDTQNQYILPPFVSNDGRVVDGLQVIESNIMPDNQIVVGDTRFARIYQTGDVALSRGYSGTQFIEDEITLKARKRLLFLIRTVDQTGFFKVTDVNAALTALGTAPAP